MILILISWLYIFFTAISFGIVLCKIVRLQQFEIIITTIFGLFSVTLLATVWAFFGPINIAFHLVLCILSLLIWYKNKATLTSFLKEIYCQINLLSIPIKIFLVISSLLILAQSSTLPFIIDNESYYIQTIKWLNEYGFVKGLANLHLFLGQTSGWHITQSIYSFSFLYDRFNDLNGFCLLIGNFFAFQKLNYYFSKGNRMDLVFGLLPLTYVFLFQFISAPSPDLPIYVFGFILFSAYLQNEPNKDQFIIVSVLAFFAVFIKITAVVLLLFPLMILIKQHRILKKQFLKVTFIGSFVFILILSKNTILTGYPLFPLLSFRIDVYDYTVPSIIMDFFFSKSMLHSFYMPYGTFDNSSVLSITKKYFFDNGLSGYIAIASLLIMGITPIVLIKKRLVKSIWTIYLAFIIVVFLLIFSSPQYRFYIYFSLFFLLVFLSFFISNQKQIIRLLGLNIIAIAIILIHPMSFNNVTKNKFLTQNTTFHFKNFVIPEPNSKWSNEFKKTSIGNMHYHSPIDTSFFWVTGNGHLPCVNKTQLNYFHKGFFFIPQQRSIDLSNGFYAQKVSSDE
ncbi:LIC_10190 family membrane protein [Flavobacterium sp.]|jgi:hypothetical protein|uniref:LIC_10190 family membrane protein n=1 Tax=Flavobacterium sp. TaxID=239 RepID=UPI0037BFEEC3